MHKDSGEGGGKGGRGGRAGGFGPGFGLGQGLFTVWSRLFVVTVWVRFDHDFWFEVTVTGGYGLVTVWLRPVGARF